MSSDETIDEMRKPRSRPSVGQQSLGNVLGSQMTIDLLHARHQFDVARSTTHPKSNEHKLHQ